MTAFEISQIQFHQYVVKGHFISVIFSGYTGASLLWGKHVLKRGIENSSGSPYQRLITTYGNNVEIDSSPAATMSGLLYIYIDSTMKL